MVNGTKSKSKHSDATTDVTEQQQQQQQHRAPGHHRSKHSNTADTQQNRSVLLGSRDSPCSVHAEQEMDLLLCGNSLDADLGTCQCPKNEFYAKKC